MHFEKLDVNFGFCEPTKRMKEPWSMDMGRPDGRLLPENVPAIAFRQKRYKDDGVSVAA